MHRGVKSLLGFAAFMATTGVIAGVSAASALAFPQIATHVMGLAVHSLGSGLWLVLTQICAGLAALLAVLTATDWILYRRPESRVETFSAMSNQSLQASIAEARRRIEVSLLGETPNVITAFNELVRGAGQVMASDIHLSPNHSELRITYRVNGTLRDVCQLPLQFAPPLTTRAKVLAHLDTHIRGMPQDGRLVIELDGTRIDARVSCLPTEVGERVVMRIVRGGRQVPDLESLGFSEEVLRGLKEILTKPQGLLFVTAPVGSGKTTTLYAAMQSIVASRGTTTSIVTLEDPIEMVLPFATQTQINTKSGLTFAATLRSVLRQDPNVLMVGEIRDRETAAITMQAGLTGHLILTTVHGESAAAPFARLGELQIEPFVLASATVGCLSQRLVRMLCTACRREAPPEVIVVDKFKQYGIELPAGRYFEPVGCDYCETQGFTTRVPVAELMVMGPQTRKAVNDRLPSNLIHEIAVHVGMTPLIQDGLARAMRGETSLTEVLRVAG